MSDASNNPEQSDDGDARRRLPSLHPFAVFGYLLGAISLIGLADDLDLVVLYGKLEVWFEAYNRLVKMLFGWIDLWWMRITPAESHIAVMGLFMWSAIYRALPRIEEAGGPEARWDEGPRWATAVRYALLWATFTLLPMLLLPGSVGTVIGLAYSSALVVILTIDTVGFALSEDHRRPDALLIWREIAVVGAAAGLIVVLNYAVFRAIEGG